MPVARESRTILRADFIEAAGQWITDIGGYFANQREAVPEVPSWSLVTKIISAAVVYE